MSQPPRPLSYRDAGVDIDAGDAFVEAIKPIAHSTFREGCVTDLGGFGALFEIPERYRRPLLVAGTDGVGTKLKLAFESRRHTSVGIDLVAMCANDVLVQGAEPLFFLDYLATGRLESAIARDIVIGIGEGCRQAGAALIGGETAEMPGIYTGQEYDLAGFCVGVVERDELIDGRALRPGAALIGLASSGPHANGYSLIRKLIDDHDIDLSIAVDDLPLIDRLLAPTRIYVKPILELLKAQPVQAMCHITGGGLPGNLRRVLQPGTGARIDAGSWRWPAIFRWLQERGGIETDEMYRTFNCGVGFVVVVPEAAAEATLAQLHESGQTAWRLGSVEAQDGEPDVLIQ